MARVGHLLPVNPSAEEAVRLLVGGEGVARQESR
jgi:hypothetical protein